MAPQNPETVATATTAKPGNAKTSASASAPRPIKNALAEDVEHRQFEHTELLAVYPKDTHDPIPVVDVVDRAAFANPTFKNLLEHATVTHLAPKIGTELGGIQLHELTDAQKDELALLVAHRGVVFFRDQEISAEQQLALGKYYGPLHVHQNIGHVKDQPELLVVDNFVEHGEAQIQKQLFDPSQSWHSDVSNERQPPSYTSFKILTTPPLGGDTLWASAYEAYERLTPTFRKFLEGLTAIHSSKKQADGAIAAGQTLRRPWVEFEHPVIRTHPVTRKKALYVNAGFTTRIVQLSRTESDAVLRFLFKHIAAGHEFQVRYRWTKNAVAIWDNRVTVHFATFDYLPGNRHAVRVTPHGEIPFFAGDEDDATPTENAAASP